jgi:hypothetical protein
MDWLKEMMTPAPCRPEKKPEVENLLAELIKIGKNDDFLSTSPGAGFNSKNRNIRAMQIGARLNEIGGMPLMEWVRFKVKRKLKTQIAEHLDYAWDDVGPWRA